MKSIRILPLIFLPQSFSSSNDAIRIPGGHIRSTCLVQVANGAIVSKNDAENLGTNPCVINTPTNFEQIYAQDVHAQNASLWSSFIANWVVPELPTSAAGQVDYHWPGFKSGQPEMGYPVLQPVLQYGQMLPARWQLQSWFVHGGAVTAPAVEVSPGDHISSSITFNASSEIWTVIGTNEITGEASILHITKERLGNYTFDWAMIVHETIMPTSEYCTEYPAGGIINYTSLELDGEATSEGDGSLWTFRVQKTECSQAVSTPTSGAVELSWNSSAV